MMYLMTLALLVVILSIQVQIHAGPIFTSAVVQELHGDKDIGTLFARAEDTVAGNQEPGTTSTSPKKCTEMCSDIHEPHCATNSNGLMKKFGNQCESDKWNCEYPNDKYGSKVACSA